MDQQRLEAFFMWCAENRDLCRNIYAVCPLRPHDGVSIALANAMEVWFSEEIGTDKIPDSMQGFIDITRARLSHRFVHERTEEFILMIDNDMEPPIDLPMLLARHNKPIVGSCAVSMNIEGNQMMCAVAEDVNGAHRFIEPRVTSIPATGLLPVVHCGTGAMMIRRDVLEAFSFKNPTETPFLLPDAIRHGGVVNMGIPMVGEDLYFCEQARKRGFETYVDLEAQCGHRKTMRLAWPEERRDPAITVEDFRLPAKGYMVTKRK
jgi:hypothetical protein